MIFLNEIDAADAGEQLRASHAVALGEALAHNGDDSSVQQVNRTLIRRAFPEKR